eukprot:256190-Chlamydomonas_euryale.AAC.1
MRLSNLPIDAVDTPAWMCAFLICAQRKQERMHMKPARTAHGMSGQPGKHSSYDGAPVLPARDAGWGRTSSFKCFRFPRSLGPSVFPPLVSADASLTVVGTLAPTLSAPLTFSSCCFLFFFVRSLRSRDRRENGSSPSCVVGTRGTGRCDASEALHMVLGSLLQHTLVLFLLHRHFQTQ